MQDPRKEVVQIVKGFSEGKAKVIADGHLNFEVRGVLFAQLVENQDTSGRLAVNCKALPGAAFDYVDRNPTVYHIPKYLGSKGWVGIWVDGPQVNWSEVRQILLDAYRIVAPKSLSKVQT